MFDESRETLAQKNEYTGQQNFAYNFRAYIDFQRVHGLSDKTQILESDIWILAFSPLWSLWLHLSDSGKPLLQIQGGDRHQSCCKDYIKIELICKVLTHI